MNVWFFPSIETLLIFTNTTPECCLRPSSRLLQSRLWYYSVYIRFLESTSFWFRVKKKKNSEGLFFSPFALFQSYFWNSSSMILAFNVGLSPPLTLYRRAFLVLELLPILDLFFLLLQILGFVFCVFPALTRERIAWHQLTKSWNATPSQSRPRGPPSQDRHNPGWHGVSRPLRHRPPVGTPISILYFWDYFLWFPSLENISLAQDTWFSRYLIFITNNTPPSPLKLRPSARLFQSYFWTFWNKF